MRLPFLMGAAFLAACSPVSLIQNTGGCNDLSAMQDAMAQQGVRAVRLSDNQVQSFLDALARHGTSSVVEKIHFFAQPSLGTILVVASIDDCIVGARAMPRALAYAMAGLDTPAGVSS